MLDVFGGVAQEGQQCMSRLVKALTSQREPWQHRAVEASAWQGLSFALMRQIGRQLVWGTAVLDDSQLLNTHSPYTKMYA